MPRDHIAYYRPRWKGEVEGYLANFLGKNHWRVARTMEYRDAMQEGFIVFAKVRARYCGPKAEYPLSQGAHFMALFKTAWNRRFIDLANADMKHRLATHFGHDASERYELTGDEVGETENAGVLATMVRQAPSEVRLVLNLFLNAPQELLGMALAHWRPGMRADPVVNRLLGREPDDELMGRVVDYFK